MPHSAQQLTDLRRCELAVFFRSSFGPRWRHLLAYRLHWPPSRAFRLWPRSHPFNPSLSDKSPGWRNLEAAEKHARALGFTSLLDIAAQRAEEYLGRKSPVFSGMPSIMLQSKHRSSEALQKAMFTVVNP